MSFWQFLNQNGNEMLTLLRQHLVLVFASTLIAVSIGVPTGILLTRNQALRSPVLGLANIMQTIPSLALFGFLIPLPFIGGIFVIEALSVILQVASYKLRKKRIFKMAPLHHHFELLGWSESKIIVRFWIASLVFALFALTTLKLR